MPDKKQAQRGALPDNFSNLEDFWGFWDTHSSADYEDVMEDVEVEIALSSSKVYFPLAKDLLSKCANRRGGKASLQKR